MLNQERMSASWSHFFSVCYTLSKMHLVRYNMIAIAKLLC